MKLTRYIIDDGAAGPSASSSLRAPAVHLGRSVVQLQVVHKEANLCFQGLPHIGRFWQAASIHLQLMLAAHFVQKIVNGENLAKLVK